VILCALGLVRPTDSAADLPGNWRNSLPGAQCKLVLSGGAAVCWTFWKIRNGACFKDKFPDDQSSVIYRLCSVLNSQSILQKSQGRRSLERSRDDQDGGSRSVLQITWLGLDDCTPDELIPETVADPAQPARVVQQFNCSYKYIYLLIFISMIYRLRQNLRVVHGPPCPPPRFTMLLCTLVVWSGSSPDTS
jgi:hypothetical protein